VHGGLHAIPVSINGRAIEDRFGGGAIYTLVTPNYFQTMGIPIVRGRNFTAREARSSSGFEGGPLILSETTARRFWPGEDAVGKRFDLGPVRTPENPNPHLPTACLWRRHYRTQAARTRETGREIGIRDWIAPGRIAVCDAGKDNVNVNRGGSCIRCSRARRRRHNAHLPAPWR